MPKFRKGEPRPPNAGRRRGSRNRVTKEVRAAVLEALNSDDGAVEFFRRLKNSRAAEDRRTFATVCARLIPRVVEGEVDMHNATPPVVRITLPDNNRFDWSKHPGGDPRVRVTPKGET